MFADHETSIERLNSADREIPDTIVHFNLDCPPDGLTINACGREGKTILYISTNPRPNGAAYDKMIIIPAGQCKNTFIECNGNGRRRRQTTGTEEKIYVSIEGVEERNVYDLNAMTGDHSTPEGIYKL